MFWKYSTIGLFLANLLFLGLYTINPWFQREPWKTVVPEIERKMRSDDVVVFLGNFQPPPTYSMYQQKQVEVIGTHPDNIADLNDMKTVERHINDGTSGAKRIWYSQFLEWQKDPEKRVRTLIEKDFVYVETVGFFKVQFDLYERK